MFGILKQNKLTEIEYNNFRLNYCGTCKSIAKMYGHKERLFLNFDVVFLSELLSALDNGNNKFSHIKPNSCLTIPSWSGFVIPS